MITGDSALTACHVAKELEIVTKPTLILKKVNGNSYLIIPLTNVYYAIISGFTH